MHESVEDQQTSVQSIGEHLKRWLDSNRKRQLGEPGIFRMFGPLLDFVFPFGKHGNRLVMTYMVMKIMFLVISIGQLYVLHNFLNSGSYYGDQWISNGLTGTNFEHTERFPRVTMCELKMRHLGNVRQYTVQCVLPLNIINEVFFTILYFCLLVLTFLNICSILFWSYVMTSQKNRRHHVMRFLWTRDPEIRKQKKEVAKFCDIYLKHDGVFVLRLVSKNADDVIMTDVIQMLWDHYQKTS